MHCHVNYFTCQHVTTNHVYDFGVGYDKSQMFLIIWMLWSIDNVKTLYTVSAYELNSSGYYYQYYLLVNIFQS